MSESIKDNLAAMRALAAKAKAGTNEKSGSGQQGPHAAVSETRDQIHEKLKTFLSVIENDDDDLDLDNDFYAIAMVNELLKKPNAKVVSAMGLERADLVKVMQAIFGLAQNRFITSKGIRSFLRQPIPFIEVVYRDMLGLHANSTKKTMQEKLAEFSEQLEPLNDLFECEAGPVTQALDECSGKHDTEAIDAIVKEADLTGQSALINKDEIETILADLKKRKKIKAKPVVVPPANPKPNPVVVPRNPDAAETGKAMDFYNRFWNSPETKPYYYPLYYLHSGLKCSTDAGYDKKYGAKFFGGKDRATVMKKIDAALGDGMAKKFQSAATSGDDYRIAFIKVIAMKCGKTDYGDALKDEVIRISKILSAPDMFPGTKHTAK